MIRYEIVIWWSNEDGCFIAEVPELPGCTGDGKTYQEALSNTEVIIREWIETAGELNRPVPEPKGRIPVRNEDCFDILAAEEALKEPGSVSWDKVKEELGL